MEFIRKLLNQFIEENSADKIVKTAHELYAALMDFTDFDRRDTVANQEIITNGSAITAAQATDCIKDGLRTKRFLEGIIKAIDTKLKSTANPIKILYAGCGSFAPFCTLPLIYRQYTPEQVQFHLIDINDHSVHIARRFLDKLNFNDYIISLEKNDCTEMQLHSEYDIFITETMDRALNNESMFYIWRNIVPQLNKDTTIIPATVKVYLSDKLEMPLSELDAELLLDLYETINKDGIKGEYPSKTFELQAVGNMYLHTRVVIDDELILEENESYITKSFRVTTLPFSSGTFNFNKKIRKWEFVGEAFVDS